MPIFSAESSRAFVNCLKLILRSVLLCEGGGVFFDSLFCSQLPFHFGSAENNVRVRLREFFRVQLQVSKEFGELGIVH